MLWGKHKTRDNTNEIEMRDNNNFHRIIFQVFEHCLSVLCSLFDFFIVIWHTHSSHTHKIFTRITVFHHRRKCYCSFCLELLFLHHRRRVFFFNQISVLSHCGMWFWCTLTLVFPFRKPSYTIILPANPVLPAQCVLKCSESHRTFLLRIRLYYPIYRYILYRCWAASRYYYYYYYIVSKCVVFNRYIYYFYVLAA